MPELRSGSSEVSHVYLGSTRLDEMYIGERRIVWSVVGKTISSYGSGGNVGIGGFADAFPSGWASSGTPRISNLAIYSSAWFQAHWSDVAAGSAFASDSELWLVAYDSKGRVLCNEKYIDNGGSLPSGWQTAGTGRTTLTTGTGFFVGNNRTTNLPHEWFWQRRYTS